MGFWGIEVKPGKPHPYHSDNVQGSLYVTQATLGLGKSSERCILQCSVGHKNPIFLCSLLPDKTESCSLNLEFKDELVAFSVIGPRSIYLSGYFLSEEGDHLRDEYGSDSGVSMSTDSEGSSEFDYVEAFTDDDDDDEDDDFEMFSPSPVPNSGVVIEEIVDDEKPTHGNDRAKRSKKKNSQPSEHEDQNNSQRQIVKSGTGGSVLESEDEDGFPIASSQKNKAVVEEPKVEDVEKKKRTTKTKKRQGAESDDDTGKKRKAKSAEEGQQIKKKKEKLKENSDKVSTGGLIGDDNENDINSDGIQQEEVKGEEFQNENKQRGLVTDANNEPGESASDKKKKKKKKNKKTQDDGEDASKNKAVSAVADESKSPVGSEDKPSGTKSSQVRTFPNGLVIEEIAMGKPDGKKASPGSQVGVRYIGKLQKNGKIFDSNVGKAPFKFRLGVGQVIKGWDVGVNGMRVGDKRRLTIPPAMGYGATGAGGKIPPNAWLVFDVELVNVK